MEKKMIKVDFVHIAQKAILDKGTNLLSLINIIDNGLISVGFPFVVQEFSLALRTTRDIDSDSPLLELDIIIQQEDKTLLKNKIKIDYQDKKNNNTVICIHGLVIEKPIPVEIIFKKDGEQLTKLEIPINTMDPTIEQSPA
jgi:hypothetical protein